MSIPLETKQFDAVGSSFILITVSKKIIVLKRVEWNDERIDRRSLYWNPILVQCASSISTNSTHLACLYKAARIAVNQYLLFSFPDAHVGKKKPFS